MTERSPKRDLAIAAVATATVVWGSIGVLVKTTAITGLTFAMYRLWLGVLIHVAALAVTRRRLPWDVFRACALGGALFATDIALGFSAVKLTTVANAAIIGALAPVLIVLASARWLGERIGRREVVLTGASFVGVVVVAVGSAGSPAWSPIGDLLALASTLVWTAYWFFSRRARVRASALEYMTSVMIAGAIWVTPIALIRDGIPPAWPSPHDWAVLVTVALIPGAAGHLLVAWSHRHVESWLSALITQCVPIVAALTAWLVLGEPITAIVAVGGLTVLGATGLLIVGSRSPERRERDEGVVEPAA
jgi:drug/metabolite transporter (DMT)-like permease